MRIGVLDVGNDEEVWKRVVREEGDVTNENERHENKLYRSAEQLDYCFIKQSINANRLLDTP